MKKIISMIICVTLAATLVATMTGCASVKPTPDDAQQGSADTESTKPETKPVAAKPKDLEVKESGWSVAEGGYIQYGIGVKNPNSDFEANLFTITVTGKDSAGKILFSEFQILGPIYPNAEYYYGASAGNGVKPDKVEFIVSVNDKNWKQNSTTSPPRYSISNTNKVAGSYNMTSFTGEIQATGEKAPSGGVWVSVIMRNKDNKIVGGYYAFTDVPQLDKKFPFEIRVLSPVEHEKYEIYAYGRS